MERHDFFKKTAGISWEGKDLAFSVRAEGAGVKLIIFGNFVGLVLAAARLFCLAGRV
jgi:hypothetical protein